MNPSDYLGKPAIARLVRRSVSAVQRAFDDDDLPPPSLQIGRSPLWHRDLLPLIYQKLRNRADRGQQPLRVEAEEVFAAA